VETKRSAERWRFAKQMATIFDGFRNAHVYRISEGKIQGLRIDLFTDQQVAERLSMMASPALWDGRERIHIETGGGSSTIQLTKGNYVVSSSKQNFYGGQFQGSSFGDYNSLTNYFGVVGKLSTVDEDTKQRLKEACEAIENSDLSDKVKTDVIENLNKLTAEMKEPEKDPAFVQRYWNRIKEGAPTVASILASAASLAKLLGGG
jgi:hypothetical protein